MAALLLLLLLLRKDFAGVKLHQHGPIRVQFLDRDRETKIVEQEKL